MQARELNTQLVTAAKAGQLESLLSILSIAKNATITDLNLHEPLSWAAHNGHTHVIEALLNNGADVNYKDMQDNTPLHWAAYNGHTNAVELLISRGANELIMNKNSLTPAKFAQVHTSANPQVQFMPALIEKMVQEIAQLKARVADLESQLANTRAIDKQYFPANEWPTTAAYVMSRYGMTKR